jgi:hypothetical protein
MKSILFALVTFGLAANLVAGPAVAAVSALPAPVVVVYPLSVTGSTDPDAGSRLALLFATQLVQEGGITVKPPEPGAKREDFLQAAKDLNADYYITGYITPVGDSVSLVDQVVSTYSGIVVWSNTTEIRTYAEALGQADLMRSAILRHAGRTLASLDQPAQSTPAPSASHDPQQGNLSGLFKHKPKSTPAPAPAPVRSSAPGATVPTAAPGVVAVATHPPPPQPPPSAAGAAIVVAVGGTASANDRNYAATVLSKAVASAGLGGTLVTTRTTADLPGRAAELCTQNRAASIFGGTLSMQQSSGAFSHTSTANFELVHYDCSGALTSRESARSQASGRTGTNTAIDHAVGQTLTAALKAAKTSSL